jgi:hypothetical protein
MPPAFPPARRPSLRSTAAHIAALAAVAVLSISCGGTPGCSELDCESSAAVSYSQSIAGAYDLELGSAGLARCNDPASMEVENNPDWISCGPSGFEITGPQAEQGDVRVTITLVDPDMTQPIRGELVTLNLTEDGIIEPNGPGCPPTCVERFGEILFPSTP